MRDLEMIIMVGNIGSGKSYFAAECAKKGYVVVNMDVITAMIGGGDYRLYDPKKKPLYRAIEEFSITGALSKGFSVVIDRTNVDIARRKRYINLGFKFTHNIIAVDFGAGTKRTCLFNRLNDDLRNVPLNTWKTVFDKFYWQYEKPEYHEGFSKIIRKQVYSSEKRRLNV